MRSRISGRKRYVLFNAAYPNRYTLEDIVGTLIRNYFPKTREFLLPGGVVTVAAAMLRPVSVANVGIHPDRVTKLVRSTNIYPKWLEGNSFNFPKSLDPILARWEKETGGHFRLTAKRDVSVMQRRVNELGKSVA